jgi:hypothetical protein
MTSGPFDARSAWQHARWCQERGLISDDNLLTARAAAGITMNPKQHRLLPGFLTTAELREHG